jgi:hypothetical protein
MSDVDIALSDMSRDYVAAILESERAWSLLKETSYSDPAYTERLDRWSDSDTKVRNLLKAIRAQFGSLI